MLCLKFHWIIINVFDDPLLRASANILEGWKSKILFETKIMYMPNSQKVVNQTSIITFT